MKVLVTAAAYPSPDGKRPLYYIHSRNLFYRKAGIDVTVLNFAAAEEYTFDGIRVIPLSVFEQENADYDMLICHAANLRNHYRFLKRHGKKFAKTTFFFHGHEVLHLNKYYPKPFPFSGESKKPAFLQDRYDDLKLFLWKHYYLKHIDSIRLVFVSKWIYDQFLSETGISPAQLKGHAIIISNSVGLFFEEKSYQPTDVKFDFLTIRGNLDGSKYGVDIVVDLARKHPQYKFCIVGKGQFFDHVEAPANVTLVQGEMAHEDMETYMNASRYALLPTREDTQGLIACEMATFGLPLITSDIDVCREVFVTCPNVALISNTEPDLEAALAVLKPAADIPKWETYFAKNTIHKEIEYLKNYGREA